MLANRPAGTSLQRTRGPANGALQHAWSSSRANKRSTHLHRLWVSPKNEVKHLEKPGGLKLQPLEHEGFKHFDENINNQPGTELPRKKHWTHPPSPLCLTKETDYFPYLRHLGLRSSQDHTKPPTTWHCLMVDIRKKIKEPSTENGQPTIPHLAATRSSSAWWPRKETCPQWSAPGE